MPTARFLAVAGLACLLTARAWATTPGAPGQRGDGAQEMETGAEIPFERQREYQEALFKAYLWNLQQRGVSVWAEQPAEYKGEPDGRAAPSRQRGQSAGADESAYGKAARHRVSRAVEYEVRANGDASAVQALRRQAAAANALAKMLERLDSDLIALDKACKEGKGCQELLQALSAKVTQAGQNDRGGSALFMTFFGERSKARQWLLGRYARVAGNRAGQAKRKAAMAQGLESLTGGETKTPSESSEAAMEVTTSGSVPSGCLDARDPTCRPSASAPPRIVHREYTDSQIKYSRQSLHGSVPSYSGSEAAPSRRAELVNEARLVLRAAKDRVWGASGEAFFYAKRFLGWQRLDIAADEAKDFAAMAAASGAPPTGYAPKGTGQSAESKSAPASAVSLMSGSSAPPCPGGTDQAAAAALAKFMERDGFENIDAFACGVRASLGRVNGYILGADPGYKADFYILPGPTNPEATATQAAKLMKAAGARAFMIMLADGIEYDEWEEGGYFHTVRRTFEVAFGRMPQSQRPVVFLLVEGETRFLIWNGVFHPEE